jgi:hypothetical protein
MAMQTESGHPFCGHGILGPNSVMAGYASLIFIGGWRQRFSRFVAGTTLSTNGSFGIKLPHLVLIKLELIMGVVAMETVFIFFAILDLLCPMDPLIQVLYNFIVTIQAGIQVEEVFQAFVHFCRIWVETPGNVHMTVLAGILTVD